MAKRKTSAKSDSMNVGNACSSQHQDILKRRRFARDNESPTVTNQTTTGSNSVITRVVNTTPEDRLIELSKSANLKAIKFVQEGSIKKVTYECNHGHERTLNRHYFIVVLNRCLFNLFFFLVSFLMRSGK